MAKKTKEVETKEEAVEETIDATKAETKETEEKAVEKTKKKTSEEAKEKTEPKKAKKETKKKAKKTSSLSAKEAEEIIVSLANAGRTPSEIGLRLRDENGVKDFTELSKKTIQQVLKENNLSNKKE